MGILPKLEKAILGVEEALGRYDGFKRLEKASIQKVEAFSHGRIVAGWEILLPCSGGSEHGVWIGIDSQYPHSWPIFAVSKDHTLQIPHVELTGKICINSEQDKFRPDNPGQFILEELRAISQLLAKDPKDHEADFRKEFQSYLLIHTLLEIRSGDKKFSIISLLDLKKESPRNVYLLRPKKENWPLLLSENFSQGNDWYLAAFGESPGSSSRIVPFLFYPHPLVPSEYPKTGEDLFNLVEPHIPPEFFKQIQSNVFLSGKEREISIAFRTDTGLILTLWRMKKDKSRHCHQSPRCSKYTGPLGGIFIIDRIDPEWLVFRGGMGREKDLRSKTVGIIGCGALGGYVAEQLVKSGVGGIHLVDSERMEWDNAGRHILGGMFHDIPKPSALKMFLTRQFPSCKITAHDSMNFHSFLEKEEESVLQCDILVVLTGNAVLMRQINLMTQQDLLLPPVVYGWTEEYGLAGHAVFVSGSRGCLQCTRDPFFDAYDRVVSWEDGASGINQLPGCGSSFASFGTAEIMPITGMISSLVLDVLMDRIQESEYRIWVGRRALLKESSGASWSKSFEERHGDVGEGGRILTFKIVPQNDCEACNGA